MKLKIKNILLVLCTIFFITTKANLQDGWAGYPRWKEKEFDEGKYPNCMRGNTTGNPETDSIMVAVEKERITKCFNTVKKTEKGVGHSAPNAKMTTVQEPVQDDPIISDDPVNNDPTTQDDDFKSFALWNKFFKHKVHEKCPGKNGSGVQIKP